MSGFLSQLDDHADGLLRTCKQVVKPLGRTFLLRYLLVTFQPLKSVLSFTNTCHVLRVICWRKKRRNTKKDYFAFLFLFSLAPSLHLSNPAHVYACCSEQNVKSKFAGAENKPHSLCRVNKIKDITFHF